MRRALVACCLLVAACKPGPPTDFGVNLTVDASHLSATVRDAIVSFSLRVSGGETYQHSVNVQGPVRSGAVHIHYVPAVSAGALSFEIDATDGSGAVIASALSAAPVALVPGKAVAATLILMSGPLPDAGVDGGRVDASVGDLGAGNGQACSSAAECESKNCTEGYCCDQPCQGICESCAIAGKEGSCSAVPANSDPRTQCVTQVGARDGGSDNGGIIDAGLNFPDGGVTTTPLSCSGTCNGARACKYPDGTTACGGTFCNAPDEPVDYACDGKGGCVTQTKQCANYVCSGGSCKVDCSAHEDCLPDYYCNSATNQCVTKKGISLTCVSDAECASGYCVANAADTIKYCCNSACNGTGMACDHQGSEGKCSCNGLTCANGCRLFYLDADLDGYGDPAVAPVAGCEGMSSLPSGGLTYVPDNTDCDDSDNRAHPGQTAYFGGDPGQPPGTGRNKDGSFDFNCDSSIQKEKPEYPGQQCEVCGLMGPDAAHGNWWWCNPSTAAQFTCGQPAYGGNDNNNSWGFNCGFYCGNPAVSLSCCATETEGFVSAVSCGTDNGSYQVCGTCSGSSRVGNTTSTQRQRCH